MKTYGDDALFSVSCDGDRFPPTKPPLMQFSDRWILLGNPVAAQVSSKNYDVEIVRNRTPLGDEMVSDNPNVTSGGGSIPWQPYFINGGVQDNQTAWDRIISGVLGTFSSNGIYDPARSTDSEKNDNGIGCNCSGNVDIGSGPGDGNTTIDHGVVDGIVGDGSNKDGNPDQCSKWGYNANGICDSLPCCGPLDGGAPCNPDPKCGDSAPVCPAGCTPGPNGLCLCTQGFDTTVRNPNSGTYGSLSSTGPSAVSIHQM